MGYYTIIIFPAIPDMTTIVTEFGKFRYNRLPMGMLVLGDIFQAKVDKILGDIEGVKMNIYDILVLSKDCLTKHKNVNSSKRERLFMYIFHLKTQQN